MVALLRRSFFPLTDDLRAAGTAFDDHRALFYARLRHSDERRKSPLLSQPLAVSGYRAPAARVAAWIAEDTAAGPGDWEQLKAELDRDRLSSRALFAK